MKFPALSLALMMVTTAFVLSSCTYVAFDQPIPPEGAVLAQNPPELIGKYENSEGDELIIEQAEIQLFDKEHEVGPSSQLKKFKDIYFLNLKDDHNQFQVFFGKLQGKDIEVYWFDGEDPKTIQRLKKYTNIEPQLQENGEVANYLIHITQADFLKLMEAEAFNELGIFYRVD